MDLPCQDQICNLKSVKICSTHSLVCLRCSAVWRLTEKNVQNVPCPLSQVLISAPNDHLIVSSYTYHLQRIKQTGILGHVWWVPAVLWRLHLFSCYCLRGMLKKGGMPALGSVLNTGLHPNSSGYGCKPHTAHKVIATVWGDKQVLLYLRAVVA